jgi:hypothetical protein
MAASYLPVPVCADKSCGCRILSDLHGPDRSVPLRLSHLSGTFGS